MKIRSCINRYMRYLLLSVICSSPALFINSGMLINMFRLQLVSTVVFLLVLAGDSFVFESYFGKHKHFKFGILYPYAGFLATSYVFHFIITSSRYRYLFLPFNLFSYYDFPRFWSITLVHLLTIAVMALCSFAGKKNFYKKN